MQQMDRDRDRNGDSSAKPHANSLLDRQLEEILRTAERTHRRQLFWRRLRGTMGLVAGRSVGRRRGLSAGRLMVLGLGLCLAGMLVGRLVPGLSMVLLLAGVVVCCSPIFLARGSSPFGREERIWRGRVIGYQQDTPLERARQWVQALWRRLRGDPPPR